MLSHLHESLETYFLLAFELYVDLQTFIFFKKAIWENLHSKKGNNCNNNNLHVPDFKFCPNCAKDLRFCQIYATDFKLR